MELPLPRIAVLSLAIFAPALLSGALEIDGGLPGVPNKRFENDPSFIAGELLTGVGRSINSSEGTWGTLISPNVILSALHYHPQVGHTVTFHASNNPAGPSESRTIIAGQQIAESDLWVGILELSLPPEYAVYPLIAEPILNQTEFEASGIYDQAAFILGRAEDVTGEVANLAAGYNRIDYWYDSATPPPGSTTDRAIAAVRNLETDSGYLQYEAFLQTYDSGAPVLMELDGTLTLIGINWFIGTVNVRVGPGPLRERGISGFSYAGNYAPQLTGITQAFAIDVSSAYVSWTGSNFPAGSDLAATGPSVDSDLDGLINFLEYAFDLDPLDPSSLVPFSGQTVLTGGDPFISISFRTRDDSRLAYFVDVGTSPAIRDRVELSFNGSGWVSANPSLLTVESASNLGGGVWSLSLRSANSLLPGQPLFISPAAEPLPY